MLAHAEQASLIRVPGLLGRLGDRSGDVEHPVVPPRDRLHVAGRRGQEDLAGPVARPRSARRPRLPRTTPGRAPGSRRPGSRCAASGCAARRRRRRRRWCPVPSQRCPARLAKIASVAPRRLASASATTFSAYDVVFSPARAPRSLRGQGTVATATSSAAGGQLVGDDDQRRVGVAAAGAQRRRAGRVGDPQPRQRPRRAVEDLADPAAYRLLVGLRRDPGPRRCAPAGRGAAAARTAARRRP